MKRIYVIGLLFNICFGQIEQALTLDDIFDGKFETAHVKVQWIPGTDSAISIKYDSTLKTKHIQKIDMLSGDTTEWIHGENLSWNGEIISISGVSFDAKAEQMLIKSNVIAIWRHSRTAQYFVYNISNKSIIQLTDGEQLSNVKFSPDGKWLAYCKSDNNLYVMNINRQREKRLTRDGSLTILNGKLGWLYEEEFGLYDGFEWSPDSKRIAFYREDQSEVKKYSLFSDDSLYPQITEIHYPKAGETNPSLKIGIINLKGGIKWVPIQGNNKLYLPRIDWSPAGDLYIQSLNRLQNHLLLRKYELRTRKLITILSENSETWVNIHGSPYFLKDGSFLWLSSRSGYKHIYRIANHKMKAVMSGKWSVSSIGFIDEDNNNVYFSGKKDSPLEQHLYEVPILGGKIVNITPKKGWHSVRFSPKGNFFVDSFSSTTQLPSISLKDKKGNQIRILKETNMMPFVNLPLTSPKLTHFRSDDGVELDVSVTLPWDFDSTKTYPVLIYGYGLPNSQTVTNRWGGWRYMYHQLFAQKGYIVASINNRQVGGYGQTFMDNGYEDLGEYLIEDHINLVKALGKNDWADTSRVGIWGWSGGGYLASLALTKGAKYFDVGIAVAPVTDLKYYDSAYTERFIGMPSENKKGYKKASVMTYVDRFKGKLLLLHGTGDDNVHVQNTHQLINVFIKEDKHLDTHLYPGKSHGISGGNTSKNLYRKMLYYFFENL